MSLISLLVVFIYSSDSWDDVVDLDIKHRAIVARTDYKETVGSIMTTCFGLFGNLFSF